jgi:very-short-patch-repair endonuclease
MSEQDELGRVVRGQRIEQAKLQRAKELRRAMTPAEARLWSVLRRSQFLSAHFRRQQIIAGFIVDFYCHAAHLAIEVDGAAHHGQEEYDAERDHALAGHGVRVLRVSNDDVERHMPTVLERIAANLSPAPSPEREG